MKILFVSNINPHFHNTNYYRCRALEALGHDVEFFNVARHLLPGRVSKVLPFLKRMEEARLNDQLIDVLRHGHFDLCLVVGGDSVLPLTVRRLQSLMVPSVLWTTDVLLPHNGRNIVAAAPVYDYVFCAGTEAVKALGPQVAAVWLPFACDPACHAPQTLAPEDVALYGRDIVFCGSYYPHRAQVLEALAGYDIGIWGPLWGRLASGSRLVSKAQDVRLDFTVWTRIYTAAKIVVVVHYQDGKTPCYQASPKLFEAMACGAFVLCDDQPDARALFHDQEHVVFFKDAEDLKRKVDYFLVHPLERVRISASGQREVLEKHTYRHRMHEIVRACDGF